MTAAKHFSSGRDAELIKASLGKDTLELHYVLFYCVMFCCDGCFHGVMF